MYFFAPRQTGCNLTWALDSWHRIEQVSAELHVFADVGHSLRMDGPGYFFDIWTKLLERTAVYIASS
jgi:hypothetical protein